MTQHPGYLALFPDGDRVKWFTADQQGQLTHCGEDIALDEAPDLALRHRHLSLCLVLPSHRATVLWGQLPGRHDARALQALPWLFEEEIAAEVNAISYFRLDSRGEQIQVAALDKGWLEGLLAPFAAASLPIDCITLDALLLPPGSLMRWGHRWLAHGPQGQVAEVDESWLPLWWQRAVGVEPPGQCYGPLPQAIEGWPCQPEAEPPALLAAGLPQAPSLMTTKRYGSANTKRLWIVASLLLVMLVIQGGLDSVQQYQQLAQQKQQVAALYRARFPGSEALDHRAIEKRLARLQPTAFATLLSRLPPLPKGVTVAEFGFLRSTAQFTLRLAGPAAAVSLYQAQLAGVFKISEAAEGQLMLEAKP